MSMPLVSVVLPTRNRAELLARAVGSVRSQTFRDWELVIVDDGSTDGTAELIARWTSADPRIRSLRSDERVGGAAARNRGIALARGEHVAFLDDDDEWLPEKLARQLRVMEDEPETGVVFSSVIVRDAAGNETLRAPARPGSIVSWRDLLRGNFVSTSSAMVRRYLLDEVGGFDESMPRLQDWDLWLRLADRTRIRHVAEPLVRYHLTPQAISTRFDALAEAADILLRKLDSDDRVGSAELADVHWVLGHTFLDGGAVHAGRRHLRRSLRLSPVRPARWLVAGVAQLGPASYARLTRLHRLLLERRAAARAGRARRAAAP